MLSSEVAEVGDKTRNHLHGRSALPRHFADDSSPNHKNVSKEKKKKNVIEKKEETIKQLTDALKLFT